MEAKPEPVAFERIVSARIVRRVIRRHRRVGGLGREVPHEQGYALPAEELDPEDRVALGAPEHGVVMLIADDAEPERTRLGLTVFAAWERLRRRGALPTRAIRERMHRVGETEIDEIRAVLRARRRLLPTRAGESRDSLMWSLFAAYWAELRVFDRERLTQDLPTLAARHHEIDLLLAADVPWPIPPAEPTTHAPLGPAPPPGPEHVALGARMQGLLDTNTRWAELLAPVSDRRLLHDLRKACLDAEQPIERGDLLRFVLTLGRRPLAQPLPHLGPVRVVRHLARAQARVRPSDVGLRDALGRAVALHERRVRERIRPILRAGIAPAVHIASVVEEVAFEKTLEELLDRLIAKGRLDFAMLRDAIARNHAKLDDLAPHDVLDDPLLAADHALATSLAGVHRRGEIYRRGLHHLSALAFGVAAGRLLSRFAILPAIGAYGVLEALQHTVGLLVEDVELVAPIPWLLCALVILGLVNFAAVRRVAHAVLVTLGRGLRGVFVTFPRWLAARRFFKTAGWRLAARWLFEPALIAAPVSIPCALLIDGLPLRLTLAIAPFALSLLLVNHPLGRRLEEATTDVVVRLRRLLSEHLLPALVAWIVALFRALLDGFERLLYAVDERLRFRAGARRRRVVLVAILAVPWRVVAYVLRLYVNLSLEPKVNPVKHFPAVTIGHKLVVPISIAVGTALEPSLGATAANALATLLLFVLPGFFGFLAWELKENWRLYARNRPRTLPSVVVGSHGETVARLLRPGFHSGTLPKLFAKLRRAVVRPTGRARDRRLAALATKRSHLEHDIARFVERDVLALCARAGVQLAVRDVELASNRIRVHLSSGHTFALEAQSGHVAGSFLPVPDRPVLVLAVAGAHRMASVDFIRETISAKVAAAPYDIDERGLVVWPGPGWSTEVVRPLTPLATPPIVWSAWVAAWEQAVPSAKPGSARLAHSDETR